MRQSLCCCIILVFSVFTVHAQCDASRLVNDCVSKLTDYNYLKSYKFVDPKPNNEFSYVFTKGNSYRITLCIDDERKKSNVEIMIFDRSRNLIVSNSSSKGKKKNVLQFTCTTSGIYYMQYDFKEENHFCGASVLAFKR